MILRSKTLTIVRFGCDLGTVMQFLGIAYKTFFSYSRLYDSYLRNEVAPSAPTPSLIYACVCYTRFAHLDKFHPGFCNLHIIFLELKIVILYIAKMRPNCAPKFNQNEKI